MSADTATRRTAGAGSLYAGAAILALFLGAALFAPRLAAHDPALPIDPVAARYLPPGAELPHGAGTAVLGTDRLGRDVASRLVHAARPALAVAFGAAGIAMLLGIGVGALAGFAGGWIDTVLMRATDALLAFPRLFLLLLAAALFGGGSLTVLVLLAATGWMGIARLARAEVRSLAARPFVEAARGIGGSPWRVVVRHVLPAAAPPLLAEWSLRIAAMLLAESTLSFLGLGAPPPAPSWGGMIQEGRDALASAWWVSVFPGLAIVLVAIAFHLVGEGLRQALAKETAA